MARQTIETLNGWTVAVLVAETPRVDRHSGLPMMFDGKPEMEPTYALRFVEADTGDIIVFPFGADIREHLVRELTGGIVPASSLPRML